MLIEQASASNSLIAMPTGKVMVYASGNKCSETELTILLKGVTPLPPSILLHIKTVDDSGSTKKDVIQPQSVLLKDDKYIWVGVIPLAEYIAEVHYKIGGKLFKDEHEFTSERLVKKLFQDQRRALIQIRRDHENQGNETQSGKSYIIDPILTSPGTTKIHIILINDNGQLADQYLGPPKKSWKSK
jgi:hypothetical protein